MPKQSNSGLSFNISILYFSLVFLYHLKLVEMCQEPTFWWDKWLAFKEFTICGED